MVRVPWCSGRPCVQAGAPTPPHPVSGSGWWTRWALTTSTRSSSPVVGRRSAATTRRCCRAGTAARPRAPVGQGVGAAVDGPRGVGLRRPGSGTCPSHDRRSPVAGRGRRTAPHPVSTRSAATARRRPSNHASSVGPRGGTDKRRDRIVVLSARRRAPSPPRRRERVRHGGLGASLGPSIGNHSRPSMLLNPSQRPNGSATESREDLRAGELAEQPARHQQLGTAYAGADHGRLDVEAGGVDQDAPVSAARPA